MSKIKSTAENDVKIYSREQKFLGLISCRVIAELKKKENRKTTKIDCMPHFRLETFQRYYAMDFLLFFSVFLTDFSIIS